MAINDGGPAYPTEVERRYYSMGERVGKRQHPGMSLRDAFAIAVAGDIWARFQSDGTAKQYDDWREGVAVEAYRLADEMLEVRARTQGASHE